MRKKRKKCSEGQKKPAAAAENRHGTGRTLLEYITGSTETYENRYSALYGPGDHSGTVRNEKKNLIKKYMLLTMAFLIIVSFSVYADMRLHERIKISNDGTIVSVERPAEQSGAAVIDARVYAVMNGGQISRDQQIIIEPRNSGIYDNKDADSVIGSETPADRAERRISAAVRELNSNTKNQTVRLPSVLEDGTRLVWMENDSSSIAILIFVFMSALFMIYRGRFDRLKKEEKAAGDSIIRELPGFINKTALMLEAGTVLDEAFDRAIADREIAAEGETSYFYDQLRKIHTRSRDTNSPMYKELKDFAHRSGVRELMRLANIITDNVNKGSDLADKLRQEGEVLWFARKKQAEEKGRVAETKLTLPLMILLLTLILVTIAPAIMDM